MSLLADLLSKVKHTGSKGDIPPNLKNIVYTSARQSTHRRRLIIISVFLTVFIISGIVIIYSLQNLRGVSDKEADMRRDVPEKTVAGIDMQSQIERDRLKVLKQEDSVEKPDIEIKEMLKAEKSQPLKEHDEKTIVTEKKEISRIERIDTFERDAYLYAARDYELKKDYSKALSLYKKVLEIERGNATVINNIAYILLHLGLIEESIKYSQMAVDINKDYVPALINLGVAHTRLGKITAAEGYFKKAFALEPDNQSVIFNLAIFYEKQNDYGAASEYYTKLIRLGEIEGFLGLARVYEKEDRIEEALKIYQSIYSLDSIDDKTRILVDQRIFLLTEKLEPRTKK
jgi:tetratricopeptide (TPR) repeat protein